MKESGKLYLCKVCNKKKQLIEFYINKSGKQKGKRISCTCILCTKSIKKEYRENNKDIIKYYRESFYNKQDKDYFEKESIRKKEWALNNPDKIVLKNKNWRENNLEKCAEYRSTYRSGLLNRTPKWSTESDRAIIKSIYKMCNTISNKTGIKHHVDHVIPLQGLLVSGLHVPSNLQILPATLNLSKGNSFSVDEDIVCSHKKL